MTTPRNWHDEGAVSTEQRLWTEVLSFAIKEALTGEGVSGKPADRIREIDSARNYIIHRNRDFAQVCSLAGLDPEAVRDGVMKQLANAPTPEVLISIKRKIGGRVSLANTQKATPHVRAA